MRIGARALAFPLAFAAALCGCQGSIPLVQRPPDPFPVGWRIVDLTRPLDRHAPHVPHPRAFPFERVSFPPERPGGVRTGAFSSLSHMGTHVAAPATRIDGGATVERLGPTELLVPVVVLDAPRSPDGAPDALLTEVHVQAYEAVHGPIPTGSAVLLRTGRGALPSGDPGYAGGADPAAYDFPGWSEGAVRHLARTRGVRYLGTDTLALDAGRNVALGPAQAAAAQTGIYQLLNLRGLGRLPARGARLVVGVLPVTGAAGAPARVLCLVPPDAEAAPEAESGTRL